MNLLATAFWVFLPAGIANMVPTFAAKIPVIKNWNTPIDLWGKYKGGRILGDNKTWRGIVFGTLVGGLVGLIQYKLILPSQTSSFYIFVATASMGFGALFGDVVESFVKRRLGVKPGKSWFPFDQLDYIFGGLIFIYPFIHLSLKLMVAIVIVYWGLHLIVNYMGYMLGINEGHI